MRKMNTDKKYAIFCTTPFHVLCAISIFDKNPSNVDVYITNQFSDSFRISKELKKQKLFHDVIHINAQKEKIEVVAACSGFRRFFTNLHSLLQYIKNCLFIESTVKKYLHSESDYDEILVASNSMAGRYAIFYYTRKKKQFRVTQFDDGVGSYLYGGMGSIPLYDRICRRLLFRRSLEPCDKILLFCPDFYSRIQKDSRKVRKIPSISQRGERIIYQLYPVVDQIDLGREFIILDTVNEGFTQSGWKRYQNLKKEIKRVTGAESLLVKKHPRDRGMSENEKLFSSVPFEVVCMRESMENKVLITTKTTAVFMPKLMFDQEPVIIFLCGMLEKEMKEIDDHSDIEILCDLYHEKDRILIPKDERELIDCLARYRDKEWK